MKIEDILSKITKTIEKLDNNFSFLNGAYFYYIIWSHGRNNEMKYRTGFVHEYLGDNLFLIKFDDHDELSPSQICDISYLHTCKFFEDRETRDKALERSKAEPVE